MVDDFDDDDDLDFESTGFDDFEEGTSGNSLADMFP